MRNISSIELIESFKYLDDTTYLTGEIVMKTKLNETLEQVVNAVAHYHATGNHRQVSFRYDPAERTDYRFSTWKHEHDADAVRSILPEDIMVSSAGDMFVVGKDNRYNLKQFAKQVPQHHRSYRLDRIVLG